jgi:enoyl-CoA hydratase/carnithine racemase
MTTSLVQYQVESGIATLTLNRPDKLNALTAACFTELRRHLDDIAARNDIGCVVLTGAGRSFCAGHSLDDMAEGDAAASRFDEAATVDLLESLPMPTIAKIRGHCFTGGLELALGCDLLVTAQSAQFGDTHGQWGLVPVWGMSVRLRERVGKSVAKELSFTSKRIDGVAAAAIGLVNQCVADDELDSAVDTIVKQVLANSADSNRIMKQLYTDAGLLPRTDALLAERSLSRGMPADAHERLMRVSGNAKARK